MTYATIAVKAATKKELDRLRKQGKHRSMDAVLNTLLLERRSEALAARVRRHAKGWENLPKDPILEEFDKASQGLDETVRRIREGWRKNHRRRMRSLARDARP